MVWSFIKPKYQDKTNLCYMDIGSFIVNTKTEIENFYEDSPNDVEKWFDTSSQEIERPLTIGKMK